MRALQILIATTIAALSLSFTPLLYGETLSSLPIQVCFTPGGKCTDEIVNAINQAQKRILIQAYQFTSPPIAKAIVEAKKRGVDVKIILDKSQYNPNKYSPADFFDHAGIPEWIDTKVNIAHNKVIILDNTTLITGSFNFSQNAQERNAENLLIIKNTELAAIYIKNWNNRLNASMPLANYETIAKDKAQKKARKKQSKKGKNNFIDYNE